jgi:hypothetical protein
MDLIPNPFRNQRPKFHYFFQVWTHKECLRNLDLLDYMTRDFHFNLISWHKDHLSDEMCLLEIYIGFKSLRRMNTYFQFPPHFILTTNYKHRTREDIVKRIKRNTYRENVITKVYKKNGINEDPEKSKTLLEKWKNEIKANKKKKMKKIFAVRKKQVQVEIKQSIFTIIKRPKSLKIKNEHTN